MNAKKQPGKQGGGGEKRRTVRPPKSSEVWAQKPELATWTAEQLQTFLTWNRDGLYPAVAAHHLHRDE